MQVHQVRRRPFSDSIELWIQMLPVTSEQAKLKVTIRAEVNMFIKAMVSNPLQEGVEKLAEMLAMIPY